jgi:predicted ATPase
MITSLTIKGYRSLKDVTIPLGPLNVMIGPNGGGKTNIMDVLALLQEAATGSLSDAIDRRGPIRSLLFAGGAKSIEVAVEISLPPGFRRALRSGAQKTLRYAVTLAPAGGGYYVKSERMWSDDVRKALGFPVFAGRGVLARATQTAAKTFLAEHQMTPAELALSRPDSVLSPVARLRLTFLKKVLGRAVCVYGLPDTRTDAPMRQPQVARMESVLKRDSSNLPAVLQLISQSDRYEHMYEDIESELRAGFPQEFRGLKFPSSGGDGRIAMRWREKAFPDRSFDAYEISDGTINFVRLATLLAGSTTPQVVCIDEPEVGLHPRLIRLVAEMLQANAGPRQFIVATHSPALVDKLNPEEVLVVEKTEGATQVRRLDPDDLKHWLDKFSLGELWQTGQLEKTV